MQLTGSYLAGPGCCAVCANSDPRLPIVDLGVNDQGIVNRRFRVYLCGTCALQAGELVAEAMGKAFVPLDDLEAVRELHARAVAAETRSGDLQAKLELIQGTFEAVAT